MYEFMGTVKAFGEIQTFASGFQKRELVVEESGDGKWPNVVAFAFKKDNVAKRGTSRRRAAWEFLI